MEIFNLFHGELDEEPHGGEPPGYELGRAARVGKKRQHSTLRRAAHLDDWDGEP